MRLVCFLQAIAIRSEGEGKIRREVAIAEGLGIVTYGEHARLIVNNLLPSAIAIRSEAEGKI